MLKKSSASRSCRARHTGRLFSESNGRKVRAKHGRHRQCLMLFPIFEIHSYRWHRMFRLMRPRVKRVGKRVSERR